jgi:hypothetical protein
LIWSQVSQWWRRISGFKQICNWRKKPHGGGVWLEITIYVCDR